MVPIATSGGVLIPGTGYRIFIHLVLSKVELSLDNVSYLDYNKRTESRMQKFSTKRHKETRKRQPVTPQTRGIVFEKTW